MIGEAIRRQRRREHDADRRGQPRRESPLFSQRAPREQQADLRFNNADQPGQDARQRFLFCHPRPQREHQQEIHPTLNLPHVERFHQRVKRDGKTGRQQQPRRAFRDGNAPAFAQRGGDWKSPQAQRKQARENRNRGENHQP